MRSDYLYDEALDDIISFFTSHAEEINPDKILDILEKSRCLKTVPIRAIHQQFMEIRKSNSCYFSLTTKEKEMWDDLFHFWE
ncbi:hypothetical protein EGJ52_07125 [Pseudomonas luteola]|uniref:hypothetical protein n=1 Tax=Pseudomonas luteola TaxID=47886 RepID=UPI000F79ED51|nr:hypothetical protein [Pseudomonas luteola]RRW45524.1 hypothetical protein EGJ52_07125 [Pseudomonas luteola]